MKDDPAGTDASGASHSKPEPRVGQKGAGGNQSAEEACVEAQQLEACVEDQQLVDRCLRGEVGAWEELYAQCHPKLLSLIGGMLGQEKVDRNLVDEMAARVWYALVANDGELLERYDPGRGARLVTFMRAIAKDLLSRHFRAERRRLKRERVALREKPQHHESEVGQPVTSLDEFLETLSPHEKAFCGNYLLGPASESEDQTFQGDPSSNIWQLSHRIRQKLLQFVYGKP